MKFGPPDILRSMLLTRAGGLNASLTPPRTAPVLIVTAELASTTANLSWTASNKTTSPGFGYKIEVNIDGAGFNTLDYTTSLTYNDAQDTSGGPKTYTYRVTPYNDAGEGWSSNTAGVVLPGEFNGPELLGPNNTTAPQYVSTDFTLTWSAVPEAVTYEVYASATDSGYTLWQAGITGTSLFVLFSAAFGVASWWYVVAKDGSGNTSTQSNHLNCTPISPTATSRKTQDNTTRVLENNTTRTLEA
jgi:hypothetical protein